jgi:hypothetical protein
MSLSCEKSKKAAGIFATARSGHGAKTICTLDRRPDVKHIVTVTNLMLYPTDITCHGLIQAMPQQIKFSSPAQEDLYPPPDPDKEWYARKSYLEDSESYSFNTAILLPASSETPSGAVEKIDAELIIHRRARPRGPEVVWLTIDVTV